MTIHPLGLPSTNRINAFTAIARRRKTSPDIAVDEAVTLSDFMQVMRMTRRVTRTDRDDIAPNGIGSMLARLNHGGSSRETGCVLVARVDGAPAGAAVLLAKPGMGLELTWAQADDDQVAEALWRKALQIKTKWNFPVLEIGLFAQMPKSLIGGITSG